MNEKIKSGLLKHKISKFLYCDLVKIKMWRKEYLAKD